ncbi:hypothetical protein ACFXAR_17630, partial [Streptomyces rubiginosohelvolus]
MKHRSPRKRWGFLAAALTVLLMLVVFATERLTDDDVPADFGAPLDPRPTMTSRGPSGSSTQPSAPGAEPSSSPSRPVIASPRSLVIPRLGVEAPVDARGGAGGRLGQVPEVARRRGGVR